MKELSALVCTNPYKNLTNYANDSQRNATRISVIVTISGETFQEITTPDNEDVQGVIVDDESPKE